MANANYARRLFEDYSSEKRSSRCTFPHRVRNCLVFNVRNLLFESLQGHPLDKGENRFGENQLHFAQPREREAYVSFLGKKNGIRDSFSGETKLKLTRRPRGRALTRHAYANRRASTVITSLLQNIDRS